MADNRTVEEVGRDLKNFIGPQRNKNEVSVRGSTLGGGVEYQRELDTDGRLTAGAGLYSGGAFNGPILTGSANYDFLKGKLATGTALGNIEGSLGIGPKVGIGPDTGIGAVMLNSGVTFNDRVKLGIGVGPAVFVPFGDDNYYRSSQPFGGALAEASVGIKF
jgi:hypothetical protein